MDIVTEEMPATDERVLSASSFTHVVDVPIGRFDIARWLFSLPDAEFQRCCVPDHIAAGQTKSDDGRRMSINVEMIGTGLVVQHYVAEIAEAHLCRMVSLSDVFGTAGRTKIVVIWELRAKDAGDGRTEYTNSVKALATDDFMAFIEAQGVSFDQARDARTSASADHNRRETPLYAESIARLALASDGS